MITCDPALTIDLGGLLLYGGHPVINGSDVTGTPAVDADGRWVWSADEGIFRLAVAEQNGQLALVYSLEGYPVDRLDSFGLRFKGIKNLRAYLKNGYHSWDGAFYVEPEGLAAFGPDESRPETGYAMTQLLARHGDRCVVLGFDRHDRFQQTFSFDTHSTPPALTILTHWDRRDLRGAPCCQSERLHIFAHDSIEGGLHAWARLVAQTSPTPPRLDKPPITGWCSWYDQYSYITEASILEYLEGMRETVCREKLPMRIFQLDDGFTPEMGDWLEVSPKFPRGMKRLLDDIRAAGFVPGLWIAPLMVGNRSRLYREHPDWVVKDAQTGAPFVQSRLYGEWRWGKRSEEYYILDVTHPEAFEYIRSVFRTWRYDWGCEYFKIDFFYWAAEFGPDTVVWHTSGLTRVEIWRRLAEMIRAEIGDDAWWLGCGCPLWASVGLVDAVRISSDVGVEWSGNLSAEALLRDQAVRNFANHVLWQIDPDCVLLRNRFHYLTDVEVRSLALYAGMSGGVLLTSDALHELSAQRLELWRLILGDGATRSVCEYPLLGRANIYYDRVPHGLTYRHAPRSSDPVLVQVRRGDQDAAVCIFNTGNQVIERTYPLAMLGLDSLLYAYDWTNDQNIGQLAGERLSVVLQPHECALVFLSRTAYSSRPDVLPVGRR